MNWLFWRQHRKQIIFTGFILLIYAAVMTWMGFQYAHTWNAYKQAVAEGKQAVFYSNDRIDMLCSSSIVMPLILGMFWGAPLIAKEYEEDTNKLVWTQGVTRRKWLVVKLSYMLGIAALYGAIISACVMWAFRTENAQVFDRFQPIPFDTQGLMPVVYAIFAVALGVVVGAWLKRVMLTLAVTMGIFVILQIGVMSYVRPHYMTPLRHVTVLDLGKEHDQVGTVVDNSAQGWNIKRQFTMSSQCQDNPSSNACVERTVTVYQPANRYWIFQGIESALYLSLSAIAIAITYWLIVKQDA